MYRIIVYVEGLRSFSTNLLENQTFFNCILALNALQYANESSERLNEIMLTTRENVMGKTQTVIYEVVKN